MTTGEDNHLNELEEPVANPLPPHRPQYQTKRLHNQVHRFLDGNKF